jgi:hypothetical protein
MKNLKKNIEKKKKNEINKFKNLFLFIIINSFQ